MSIWKYIQLVLARAWSETWAAVIRHDRGTFVRDLLMAALSLFLLMTLQGWLVDSGAMSEDNTKDTIVWAILGLIAIVAAFSIMFVLQTLLFAPYSIWKDQDKAIFDLLPTYLKKRRQPFVNESPIADARKEEICKFGTDHVTPAMKMLTEAQLAVSVQFREFMGGQPFGATCISGALQQANQLNEVLADITVLDYLQRHKLGEIESKLREFMEHYEIVQLTLYQNIEILIKLGGATNQEITEKLAKWRDADNTMNAELNVLRGRVGIPTVSQIKGKDQRQLCASAYIPS